MFNALFTAKLGGLDNVRFEFSVFLKKKYCVVGDNGRRGEDDCLSTGLSVCLSVVECEYQLHQLQLIAISAI